MVTHAHADHACWGCGRYLTSSEGEGVLRVRVGREAVIDHFRTVFAGTWRFEPDEEAIRVMPLGPDVAHIYAPTRITAGAADQEAATYTFLVNEFAIRTPEGWRISAIVPVPAQ